MTKIMCFGTFDILHKGHEYYLKEARKLGNSLVVVVARDDTVTALKKNPPRNSEQQRLHNLRGLGIADKVVLGNKDDKLKVIVDEKPDILCFGYDQRSFTENAREELEKRGVSVQIIRIPAFHPEKYKSSLLGA